MGSHARLLEHMRRRGITAANAYVLGALAQRGAPRDAAGELRRLKALGEGAHAGMLSVAGTLAPPPGSPRPASPAACPSPIEPLAPRHPHSRLEVTTCDVPEDVHVLQLDLHTGEVD